jgi:hypothetical protein
VQGGGQGRQAGQRGSKPGFREAVQRPRDARGAEVDVAVGPVRGVVLDVRRMIGPQVGRSPVGLDGIGGDLGDRVPGTRVGSDPVAERTVLGGVIQREAHGGVSDLRR